MIPTVRCLYLTPTNMFSIRHPLICPQWNMKGTMAISINCRWPPGTAASRHPSQAGLPVPSMRRCYLGHRSPSLLGPIVIEEGAVGRIIVKILMRMWLERRNTLDLFRLRFSSDTCSCTFVVSINPVCIEWGLKSVKLRYDRPFMQGSTLLPFPFHRLVFPAPRNVVQ